MRVGAAGTLVLMLIAPCLREASTVQAAEPPRHGLRLAMGFGTGLVLPPSCRDCDRFYGRGMSTAMEVGWALRSDLLIALASDVTMIPFADGTTAVARRVEATMSRFMSDRSWIRLGGGLGFREMHSDESSLNRLSFGLTVSAGAGRELARSGAWSLDVQAQASCTMRPWILMPLAAGLWIKRKCEWRTNSSKPWKVASIRTRFMMSTANASRSFWRPKRRVSIRGCP